jgi:hypothetical protein
MMALPRVRKIPRIDERLVERASKTWNDWNRSDKSWKRTIVGWANAAMERIPYDEWALKTIPARGVYLRRIKPAEDRAQEDQTEHISIDEFEKRDDLGPKDLVQVRVEYPGSILDVQQVESRLQSLASSGITRHTKYFWLSAIGAPLTLPVALIPVIPNLPGFYLLFRAWSNWRARDGAMHLKYLVDGHHLSYRNDPSLDGIYTDTLGVSDQCVKQSGDAGPDRLILPEHAIDELVQVVRVPELGPELHRAVRQVRRSLAKANQQAEASNPAATSSQEKTNGHKPDK